MFTNILVPVDLTDKNARPVEVAGHLAERSGGKVTLLHVVETLDAPFDEFKDFYAEMEDQAARSMEAMLGPLLESKLDACDRVVVFGRPDTQIVSYADGNEIDLIVLTSHRVDPENPGLDWATLSYKIAILSQVPVLLVK